MGREQLVQVQEQVAHHLQAGFTALAKAMADIIVENEPHAGKMLPKAAEKQKLAHELEKELSSFKKRFEKGASCLLAALDEVTKKQPEIDLDVIAADFAKFNDYLVSVDSQQEALHQGLSKNYSFQELVGMSDATIEALYQAAKYLYEHEQYQESAHVFGMLTFLNAKHFIFWIGLGNSEFFCHHYEPALIAYAIAVHVNPDDPSPHLYSCKCYEELGQLDHAINALDIALFVVRGEHAQEALKLQIEQEKERLQQKRGVKP